MVDEIRRRAGDCVPTEKEWGREKQNNLNVGIILFQPFPLFRLTGVLVIVVEYPVLAV